MPEHHAEMGVIRKLLCGGLTGKKVALKETLVDWQWVQKCLEEHQIMPIAWMGCKQLQDPAQLPKAFYQALEHEYQMSAGWDTCQYFALEELRNAFEMAHIDFMPLKGSILKLDYPNSPMRNMSDLDILFRPEQFAQVRPVLEKMGCRFAMREAVDESYLMGPVVHIEAHWALLEGQGLRADYCNKIWQRAVQASANSCEYKMTWDDYYIYMLAHAAKHFASNGTGLRNLADIHVFLTHHGSQLNQSAVTAQLQSLGLEKFEAALRDLQAAFFQINVPLTQNQTKILHYMVRSGAYGNWETGKINQTAITQGTAKGRRWKAVGTALFPSQETLCERFPNQKRTLFLLCKGWCCHMSEQKKHFPQTMRRMGRLLRLCPEHFDAQKELMELVGLDHSF